MNITGDTGSVRRYFKNSALTSTLALTLTLSICSTTHATTQLINFDNLSQAPCTVVSCDPTVIDNQYAVLGVAFDSASLFTDSASQIVSAPNALSNFYGPSLSIHFIGSLPTVISVYVSTLFQDAVFITAYDQSGLIGSVTTDGWRGTPETSTPYRDRQLMTLAEPSGIAQVNLESLFRLRGSLVIDDLQFGDQLNVPLPASLFLFMGALSTLWRRTVGR